MAAPVNLQELDSTEFKQFIDSFDHVVSNFEGIVLKPDWDPEAGKWINFMKELGKGSYDNLQEHLIETPEGTVGYFKSIYLSKPTILCIDCPETFELFKSHGLKVKKGPEILPENYLDFHQYFDNDPDIGAVVFKDDCKNSMGKKQLNTYARYQRTRVVIYDEDEERYAEFVLRRIGLRNVDRSKVLFVGDIIEPDIEFGKKADFQTLLVLTKESVEKMRAHEIKPDYYVESIASLIPQLEELCNKMKT